MVRKRTDSEKPFILEAGGLATQIPMLVERGRESQM
jgi:hypothetical protein